MVWSRFQDKRAPHIKTSSSTLLPVSHMVYTHYRLYISISLRSKTSFYFSWHFLTTSDPVLELIVVHVCLKPSTQNLRILLNEPSHTVSFTSSATPSTKPRICLALQVKRWESLKDCVLEGCNNSLFKRKKLKTKTSQLQPTVLSPFRFSFV